MTLKEFMDSHILRPSPFAERAGIERQKFGRIYRAEQEASASEASQIVTTLNELTGESLTVGDLWPPVGIAR